MFAYACIHVIKTARGLRTFNVLFIFLLCTCRHFAIAESGLLSPSSPSCFTVMQSPILFINDMLKVVEQAKLGVQLSSGKKIGGMLFADDFVGVSDSKESLQKLIDVVHRYCNKWRLKANVSKSAVMVFSRNSVEGGWKWGEHKVPKVSSYTYLVLILPVMEPGMCI